MKLSIIIVVAILATTAQAKSWNCRNDLEISCGSQGCEAQIKEGFTPMDIYIEESGSMTVCAYTGCWEGVGKFFKSGNFVVITGHHLKFSTAPHSKNMNENIVVVIDMHDNIGIIKAGAFAHPLICKKLKDKEEEKEEKEE